MKSIRDQFPLLKNNPDLVYLDNASTTQKPQVVVDSIQKYYERQNANVHRGMYDLSIESTRLWEDSHRKVAEFLGVESMEEIILTSGTTASLNLVTQLLAKNLLKEGDIVVLSEMEHHSNIVPWQLAQNEIGFEIAWIPVEEDYQLDFEWYTEYMKKMGEKVAVVSLVHTSNVLGVTNDVKSFFELAKKCDAITILDAAQSVAHMAVSPYELKADFLAFSGHKIYGPTGIGVLYGKRELLEKYEPVIGGGDMIRSVSKDGASWNELPWKFEAGTPNIAGGVGLITAIEFVNVTQDSVNDRGESSDSPYELSRNLFTQLKDIPEIELFTTQEIISAGTTVISFAIKDVHPHDAATILSENNIAVRGGYHCVEILHTELLKKPTIRVSFGTYNNSDDVSKLVDGVGEIIEMFK
jgi:cysteine desulfurase / selenocysteine lyase